MIKKISIPLLHIAYWLMYSLLLLVFFLFIALSNHTFQHDIKSLFWPWIKIMIGFAYVPALVGFYYGYFVAFTKHVATRLFRQFLIYGFLVVVASAILGGITMSLLFMSNILWHDRYASAIPELLLMGFISIVNLVLGCVVRGFIQSTRDVAIKEKLENQRLQMELHLLRIQINPHFLFNTLSNIDALIHQQPIQASEYLHKLSQFMRQIVYESEDTLHPLDREILMVEDYIALQQIRSPQIKLVQWKVTGTTEDVQLPPLIILPLIENCFKHGLIDTTNPLVITIAVDETQCCICLNNSLATHQKNQTGGIGLSLTNKRLTAVYGNRSHLTTYKDANEFVQQFTFPLQP